MPPPAPPRVAFDFTRITRPAAPRTLISHSDGDTPLIQQPVRMVSCDTPEKAGYAGGEALAQRKLDTARERLEGGFYDALPEGLRRHLVARLGPDAARRHQQAGQLAGEAFGRLLTERLVRPDGQRRPLAVVPTGDLIDRYGRLLAYFAPHFSKKELPPRGDPARRTFNLDMIDNGWAAFFPVYPALPRNDDLQLAVDAAAAAWNGRRGAWRAFGRSLLLGYEYRMAIKLATEATPAKGIAAAFQRGCVDLRTRRDVGAFGWWKVPPPYRLWYWLADLPRARVDLGLAP